MGLLMTPLDMPDHIVRLMWMLVMTIWLGAATETGTPVETKRDWHSDVAIVGIWIGWLVLLVRNLGDGPQLLPRIMFVRLIGVAVTFAGLRSLFGPVSISVGTGVHTSASRWITSSSERGPMRSSDIRSIQDSCLR